VPEPSSRELQERLRNLLPSGFQVQFDDDVALFADYDGETDQCGVLMACAGAFNRLISSAEIEAIGRVLATIEDLLGQCPPEDWKPGVRGFRVLIIECFLELVLPTTPGGQPMVVPRMGPLALKCVPPLWLLPDPPARSNA